MNELSPADPEYKKVLSSYYDLIKTSILRQDKEEFIGGLPITLLRRHVINLLQKSRKYPGYSKYTVTSKVDGTRLLMFINEKDPTDDSRRKVHFIDRSLKIYTLSNKEKHYLNSVRGPKMILDGELVFFKGGQSHYYLPSSDTDYLSFMVFDILYGPTSVKIEDIMMDTQPKYGSANAMAGPIGGKQWDYGRRYFILKNLIMPTKDNADFPPLSLEFADSNFFRIELKQIIYISELTGSGIVDSIHSSLATYRTEYYNFLSTKSDGKTLNDKLKKSKLEFDGLIFTPIDTEYVTENWNKFMNTQYKWKPPKEQTIDFYVKNTGKTIKLKGQVKDYRVVELYVLSRGNLSPFNFEDSPEGLVEAQYIVKDGTIAEFGFSDKYKKFMFNRLRLDKDKPNAWRTAETVKESILSPVNINLLPKLYNGDVESIAILASEYTTVQQRNRLLLCTGSLKFLSEPAMITIGEMLDFKQKTKESELEIRIGKIKGKYFNTNVSLSKYIDTNKLFDGMGWKNTVTNYVDASLDSVRTRYKFVHSIGLIKLDSIVKESVSKLDISLSHLGSFDARIANSLEKQSDKTVSFEEATRLTEKRRISYLDPNSVIRVDLTEVNLAKLIDSKITRVGSTEFQIEFEILSGSMSSVVKFLEYYITEIETTWD